MALLALGSKAWLIASLMADPKLAAVVGLQVSEVGAGGTEAACTAAKMALTTTSNS